MDRDRIEALAQAAVQKAMIVKLRIATAESCTGGLISGALTSVAGSSAVFERGFVTYSNLAKTEMLGVPKDLIDAHGAVSSEVALAMARGALDRSKADVAVSVTGIAGPGGGSAEKPVGLVFIATAVRGRSVAHVTEQRYSDLGRDEVRAATVADALSLVLAALGDADDAPVIN